MPSYTSYLRQMAVLDADDNEIESWITVRGNHIPIMKGQSKEDAVKSFLEKKDGGEKTVQSVSGQKWTGVKLEGKYHQFYKKEDAENFIKEAKAHGSKESDIELVGFGVKEGNAAKPESKKGGSESKVSGEKETRKSLALKIADLVNPDKISKKEYARRMLEGVGAVKPYSLGDLKKEYERRKEDAEKKEKVDNGKNSGKVYKDTMSKIRSFKADSDGTYDFETGKPKDYPNGFSVSFHQNEPDANGNWKSDYGRYSESDYDKNVEDLVKESGGELNIGYFAGTPEVSVWVKDRKSAIALMKKHNQHSIWDWEKGEIIENADYDPKKNPMKQ